MKFILGLKVNMTQIFDEKGIVTPVTVLDAGPMVVTQVKTVATDGYNAVQVGFGSKSAKNINKPMTGHLKGLGNFRYVQEFRKADDSAFDLKVGDKIDLNTFVLGDVVVVSAISKGRGFQGVIKRHGFKGGPRSHGQKHSERAPGSIGAVWPERVLKGKRMGGRMGADRVTVPNLKIMQIDTENNQLYVSGAIPGRKGTLVEVVA